MAVAPAEAPNLCDVRGAANVCSINEIIASKCVMMKLFWVTS